MVNAYSPVEIADLILKVCLAVWIGDILWMFAGFLFMLSPIFKMMARKKDAPTTNRFRLLCGKGDNREIYGVISRYGKFRRDIDRLYRIFIH